MPATVPSLRELRPHLRDIVVQFGRLLIEPFSAGVAEIWLGKIVECSASAHLRAVEGVEMLRCLRPDLLDIVGADRRWLTISPVGPVVLLLEGLLGGKPIVT